MSTSEDTETLRQAVRGAIECRRQAIVFELARRFQTVFQGVALSGESRGRMEEVVPDWIDVESLSQLRALVGGRFQNLKSRWVEAGLPLREHRGDRSGAAEISEEGWLELTTWIAKQGYEVRISPSGGTSLFQLRKKDS